MTYITVCKDKNGVEWVYEGLVGGIPIWVEHNNASNPLPMDRLEAISVLDKQLKDGEEGSVIPLK